MEKQKCDFNQLPSIAAQYIDRVIRKMGYRRKIRREVRQELADHFIDALRDCRDENDRQQLAQNLIESFGDAKLLAKLIRRGKKRCRSLWRKAIIRTLQATAALIVLMLLYSVWFITGKPTISVDYLKVWNQMAQPTVADADNAWPHYEKAVKLYVKPDESIKKSVEINNNKPAVLFSSFSLENQEKIRDWVKQNEPAWQEYLIGSQKPYCWREYGHGEQNTNPEEHWLIYILVPALSDLRDFSKMGVWRARVEAQDGKISQALDDCLAVIRTGRHFQRIRASLIEQLVGLAISNLGQSEIIRLVGNPSVTAASLSSIQSQLVAIYQPEYPLMDIQFQKLFFWDAVQHCFTDSGIGGGHLVPKEFQHILDLSASRKEKDMDMAEKLICFPSCLLHAHRDETLAKGLEYYDHMIKAVAMSPYQKKIQNVDPDGGIKSISQYRYLLLWKLLHGQGWAGDLAFRGKAQHEATLTILALRRWRLEKGSYPETLNDLLQNKYLEQLPVDPYSDGPLRYERRGDDFTLYSLGVNFTDDGGEVNPDDPWGGPSKKGPAKCGEPNPITGDRVFWPIREN
jgi:hypothetical protein